MLNNQQGFGTVIISCLGQQKSRHFYHQKKSVGSPFCWRIKAATVLRTYKTGAPTDGSWSCPCRWPGSQLAVSTSTVDWFRGIITGKPWKTRVFTIKIIKSWGVLRYCKFMQVPHHLLDARSLQTLDSTGLKRHPKNRGTLALTQIKGVAVQCHISRSRWPVELDS